MKQSLLFKFLTSGVITLLLIFISGFYGLLGANAISVGVRTVGVGSTTAQPGAAVFVSKNTPIMMSLLVNPDKLQALGRKGETPKLTTSLLTNTGLDYKKDIQPWLGKEITFAVTALDIDREPSNGLQPGYLIALATDKPEQSQEFVQLLFSKRVLSGANLTVEEYEGVKVISDASQPEKGILAGGVVGDKFVLFANDPKILREAINNAQAPDLNLTSFSKYTQSLEQLPSGSLGMTFLNFPVLAQWQGLQLEQPLFDSEIISLTLTNKGLLAETTVLATGDILPPSAQLSQPVPALQYIPARAGLAISGSNLNGLGKSDISQLWMQAKGAITVPGKSFVPKVTVPLTDFEKRWGIKLPEDIFSWVEGEYAIALLPNSDQETPDWVFVTEKLEGTPAGISHLDEIASSKGLNLITFSLGEKKVSAWTELKPVNKTANTKGRKSFDIETTVQGVHTSLGNYEIFTSSLETMDEVLNAKENTLMHDPSFLASVAAIPKPNQGYVYLSWEQSQRFVLQQLPILKIVKILGKPFFENLRSLTVSSYSGEPGLVKAGLFFQVDGK
jgi:Protein of unknown function (DUF3352)